MRAAKTIISEYLGGNTNISTLTLFALEEIINKARKEAIEVCAESAKVVHYQPNPFLNREEVLSQQQRDFVDKNSILNLIKELK